MPLTAVTTREGRTYNWPDGNKLASVSTVARVLNSPGLMIWYAKETAKAAILSDDWQEMSEEAAVEHLTSAPSGQADEAAQRGIQAHNLIAQQLQGDYSQEWWDISNPFVTAAHTFLTDHHLKPLLVEVEVANPEKGYAGTVDLFAVDEDGFYWIIDWKTGKRVYHQHAIQIAGYLHATKRLQVKNDTLISVPVPAGWEEATPVIVALKDDGSYRSHHIGDMDKAHTAFKACLYLYRFQSSKVFL